MWASSLSTSERDRAPAHFAASTMSLASTARPRPTASPAPPPVPPREDEDGKAAAAAETVENLREREAGRIWSVSYHGIMQHKYHSAQHRITVQLITEHITHITLATHITHITHISTFHTLHTWQRSL